MDLIKNYLGNVDWQSIIFSTLRMLLILVIAWIVVSVVKMMLRRLERRLIFRGRAEGELATESAKRAETLVRLLRQAVVIVIWVMVLLVILREVGIEIAPILASAGVVGLAVGFGAQNLVRDVIAGFFMILENQVRVGDVAIINGTGGLVEQINFRTIVLRDLAGIVHIFPNGTINTFANMTSQWSAYVFNVGVAYKEDIDRVIDIMKRVGDEMKRDERFGSMMIEDIEIFGVDKFADSAIMIQGRLKTHPIKQWDVGREYLRRLKAEFDREGVEIPFPHHSVYFGEASKPFVVQLMESNQRRELGKNL